MLDVNRIGKYNQLIEKDSKSQQKAGMYNLPEGRMVTSLKPGKEELLHKHNVEQNFAAVS